MPCGGCVFTGFVLHGGNAEVPRSHLLQISAETLPGLNEAQMDKDCRAGDGCNGDKKKERVQDADCTLKRYPSPRIVSSLGA